MNQSDSILPAGEPVLRVTTTEERLARWKHLIGDTSPGAWTEDNLYYYLQYFRPSGDGIDAVFEGMEHCELFLSRVREVFLATQEGWQRDRDIQDATFTVRCPPPISGARIRTLTVEFVDNITALTHEALLAGHSDAHELSQRLSARPEIVVKPNGFHFEPGRFGELVDTVIHGFITRMMPTSSNEFDGEWLLWYALSTMTHEVNAMYHLVWPYYQGRSRLSEPFAPAFELWKHGVSLHFAEPGCVYALVPAGVISEHQA